MDDPILVRSGRTMVPTPRAEALRDRVRALTSEAHAVLSPERDFDPRVLDRTFVIHATDHVVTVGPTLDRRLAHAAPGRLRVLPTATDDAAALRDGGIDLAIGIYQGLPPELRTRVLFTDRFVCVVREGHPGIGKRLSLAEYTAMTHVQVAPRGAPGGYIDAELEQRGLSRRVARAVPYFLAGLMLVAESDHVLTISERIATMLAPRLGLRVLEPPLPLRPYGLSLLWHPRHDADPAHRLLRDVLVETAAEGRDPRSTRTRGRGSTVESAIGGAM